MSPFNIKEGTEIIAPADGVLYKAETDLIDGVNKDWCQKNFKIQNPTAWDGWHTFFIKHQNGYSSRFLHCSRLNDDIQNQIVDFKNGIAVKQGQVIAYSGKYGGVPPHLHFEIRDEKDNIIDPYRDNLWMDYEKI